MNSATLVLPAETPDTELREHASGSGPYQVETWRAGEKPAAAAAVHVPGEV